MEQHAGHLPLNTATVIEAARTMGVGTLGMLGKVIFPYCLPGIIGSISKSLRFLRFHSLPCG